MAGPYGYNNNIPLAGDKFSTSQPQINTNFGSIQSLIDIDHVDFASANAGKHNQVTFVNQAMTPTYTSTDIGLFNQNAAPTTRNDIWLARGAANPFPMTGYDNIVGAGWSYLPSGLLITWGGATITAGGTFSVIYNNGGAGGINSFPGFATFNALPQVTRVSTTIDNNFLIVSASSTVGFTVLSSQGANNILFSYMTIGM